jgi:DNA polymerase-3 subunit epsilon
MPRWQDLRLVGFDTETTGLSVTEDRIFEVGLIAFGDGEVVDRWDPLLDPQKPLSPESSAKTGVRDADLKGKPVFGSIAADLVARLADQVVVGYNILGYDLPLLESELRRVGLALPPMRAVDVLIFARELVKTGRHNLGEMARHYGITMETAHRADADAEACVRLLLAMAPQLPPDLDALLRLQAQWRDDQRARRAVWRQSRPDDAPPPDVLLRAESAGRLVDDAGRVSLGPGYVWGRETDPLRAFLASYASVGGARPAAKAPEPGEPGTG